MKKLLILLCVFCLTGCVKNEDFSKTCTSLTKSSSIKDKTSIYVVYDADDRVKSAVVTKNYKALNEDGIKLLDDIKEASSSYNKRYASSNIKITVSKDDKDVYEMKYYLNVLKLNENILNDFNIKKNSIKFFNKMRDKNIECEG